MTELIVKENLVPAKLFKSGGIDPIIEKIVEEVNSHVPDITTGKGRDAIISLAAKVSRSKTFLDDMGKALKVDNKTIDAERKKMRDALDDLRDKTRQPVTDWEVEQKRVKAEEALTIEQEEWDRAVEKEILDAWDNAHIADELFNIKRENEKKEASQQKIEDERKAKEKAERLAKEQVERDERLKKEAVEQAVKDAEEKSRKDKEESDRLIREAAEREKQLKIDTENAEKKRLADIQTEKVRVEKERLEAAQKAEREKNEAIEKVKREQEEKDKKERERIEEKKRVDDARSADVEHRRAINSNAKEALIHICKIPASDAQKVIEQIAMGNIAKVSISY